MKKRILLVVAIMALFTLSSSAQWKFGGGLALGTKMGIDDDGSDKMGFGINGRADYSINEKFSVAGGLTYFFPSAPEGMDLTAWKLAADAHYKFMDENFSLYGIAGLGYNYAKSKIDIMGYSAEADDSEIGLDIGAGINYNKFFGEIAYNTSFEQIEITVGILFGGE